MTAWPDLVAAAAGRVADDDVDAARRALDHLCLAQLYLDDDLLLERDLRPTDVAARPAGHWGVCPPVNAVAAALGPYRQHLTGVDVRVVHGGGHAGPAALALAWLTGALADVDDRFAVDAAGLRELVVGFRRGHRFGGEITPLLPGHDHLGGQLGPALAVAQGTALDAPDRLVVALIGDGECETGATAAAWLGARALTGTGTHGRVLPVVLLNGLRMGGPSLLSQLGPDGVAAMVGGCGHRAVVTADAGTPAVRAALATALAGLRPLDAGPSTVLVVTVPKGHGAPAEVGGRRLLGTGAIHKVPLRAPRADPVEFAALAGWLASHRPAELFGPDGAPAPAVRRALGRAGVPVAPEPVAPRGCGADPAGVARSVRARGEDFGAAMSRVLTELHDGCGLRLFSPDELASNRIDLGDPQPGWVVEVLNEELCHAWAQGYQESGRRAIVVGYEAFAPIVASLLAQQLLQRRIAAAAGGPEPPGIVHLLTSLGWDNTVSHGNPGLVDVALACADPTVRVCTPADAARAAAAVASAVRADGRCSLVVAGKHPTPAHPLDTVEAELRDGCAVWPHVADDPDPDLVLVSAGDVPARELTAAAGLVAAERPAARLRYVHVHELSCLGAPGQRPAALPDAELDRLLPPAVPVLAAVPCHPTTVLGLLAERGGPRAVVVRGWRPPDRPRTPREVLRYAGLDARSLAADAVGALDRGRTGRVAR